ncbi:MAG TPA: hypothetical protein VLB00_07225 [Gemmatimonadales bacterium]|nr:hypothetical protein [Gemmatimonadales bacterium]
MPTGTLAALALLAGIQSPVKPEEEFAGIISAFLSREFVTDWRGIEKLPGVTWAALPPVELKTCLPEGGCYTRQGTVSIGGRNLMVVATGARTIVSHLFVRNPNAPLGETAVLGALRNAGLVTELVRCPLRTGAGGTNWHSVKGEKIESSHLSVQSSCNGRACEGFVLSRSDKLPPLQPAQLALYSEKCSAGSERTPVSTTLPQVALAAAIKGLIPPASGPGGYDWKTLAALRAGIRWSGDGPRPMNLSFKNDPNPVSQSGSLTLAGREFSVLASGTPAQAKVIYLDETGLHPKGEHVLGALYQTGLAVKVVRCGPVYTESTHIWYSVTSSATGPVMVLQSIRHDGNSVQDGYALRLDGTLPARDPRDRNPGTSGC